MTACSASNEDDDDSGGSSSLSGTLNGSGATSQEAAMAGWQSGFQTANPDTTVNYDAIGSGGGREQFLAGGKISFAGSDDYMTAGEMKAAEDRCGGAYIEVPVYISPI